LLARAIWELARARVVHGSIGANDIERLNRAAIAGANGVADSKQERELIARVGFLITLASRHLPWRSDCLPQAIAGQRWLQSEGLGSEIRIGVERPGDDQFGAHAWLVHRDQIVTGGEVGHFSVLLGDESRNS